MVERAFNLLREPWIRLVRADAKVEELSLCNALLHAHEYASLAGELPTQDVAVMRLMLAVLHAVFYRVDEHGDPSPVQDADAALDRWCGLWEMGRFPQEPICAYLNQYEDRFWLFHPDRPFYQANSGVQGSAYTSPKLNGEISESENKVRLFSIRAGEAKRRLPYAEAARWLLHLNAYDDAGLKKKTRTGDDLPSFQVGWLGQLGLLVAQGHNLFETLMLNFVLLDDRDECWDDACPVWERSVLNESDCVLVPTPHDQAALMTLQSRRIALQREADAVVGYALLSGEQFAAENAFSEQMTCWYKTKEGNYCPAKYQRGQSIWREWSSLLAVNAGDRMPGVCRWHEYLKEQCPDVLPHGYVIGYQALSVNYVGHPPSAVDDLYMDKLSFHLNLLEEVGRFYRNIIGNEVTLCGQLAKALETLAYRISLAGGGNGVADAPRVRERFFYAVDLPFRQWLMRLDASHSDVERAAHQRAWREEAGKTAKFIGRELVEEAGITAFVGRTLEVKKKPVFYCAPDAHGRFLREVNKLIGKGETDGKP